MLNAWAMYMKEIKLGSYFIPFSDIIDELKPKIFKMSI